MRDGGEVDDPGRGRLQLAHLDPQQPVILDGRADAGEWITHGGLQSEAAGFPVQDADGVDPPGVGQVDELGGVVVGGLAVVEPYRHPEPGGQRADQAEPGRGVHGDAA
ncbi:hypothetical protein ABGB08_06930 [Acrocarpospora sp. B8E8]